MDRLAISATANGLNYLPEYYASATGLFARAGLEVVTTAKDPWTGVLDDLASGAADLALGGLWVPAMHVGTSRELSVVAQLNHQFPMAILIREPTVEFDFTWLKGRTVLAPGAGGSAPYEFTADLVTATELQDAGHGQIAFRHLDGGGIMPNSVYYCRADRLAELAGPVNRFRGVLQQAMEELPEAPRNVIDPILTDRWPDKDHAVLTAALDQMLASEVWKTTDVDEPASDRWMRILAEGGLVTAAPGLAVLMNTGGGLVR